MGVAFYLEQVNRCLRLVHSVEDPEAKADLLAMAYDNLELARQDVVLNSELVQARTPFGLQGFHKAAP